MPDDETLPTKLTAAQQADLELQHIELELKHGRTQHVRHFVDQYYCYSNNYVNRNGGAAWGKIYWSEHVSIAADQETDKSKVIKEHVVPLKVITQLLYKLVKSGNVTTASIKAILDKYVRFATITKTEDQELKRHKYNSAMPACFQDVDCIEHVDLFCRYKAVGIVMKLAKEPTREAGGPSE